MTRIEAKAAIKAAGLYYWQVGKIIGVSENTIVRWLREDLNEEKSELINTAIKKLTNDKIKKPVR